MRLFTRKALAYVKCVPAPSFQAFGRKTWKPRPCMYGTALLVTLIAVAFEPATSALLAAGETAGFTVRATSPVAVEANARIDAVRDRDGAGAALPLAISFTPAGSPADLDGSGTVDAADLSIMLNTWGPCAACAADLDASGAVDAADIAALLNEWG